MNHVTIRLLPGGGGRVLIHWFERLDEGPIHMQPHIAMGPQGPGSLDVLQPGGAVGRIACQPNMTNPFPKTGAKGIMVRECWSDEPRAVTCPRCKEKEAYKKAMTLIAELEQPVDPAVAMQRLKDLATR